MRLSGYATCCLLFLLAATNSVLAEPRRLANEQFDPDASDTTVTCSIPPYQDLENYYTPREGLCENDQSPLSDFSDEDIHSLAVEYAPVIFFHPLEKYTMSSVDDTFSDPAAGRIFATNGGLYMVDDKLNLTTILRTSRDPIWALTSKQFFFERDVARDMYTSDPDALFGDGYDEETGLSRAKIYYNVYEAGNNTWTFNYFMYYPFNGEGNMGIVSTFQGVNQYQRFQLKPYGTHEGDWESVSVNICPPASWTTVETGNSSGARISHDDVPLAIMYRQHSWSMINDCTIGECKFYKETNHAVGFSALNSHATYPTSAEELIYTNIDVGFFFNLQAFVVVDRTMFKKEDGSYNYFFPNATNLERLQNPADLTLDAPSLEPYFWQAYGGHFGNAEGASVVAQPPLCLAEDQQSFEDCPTEEDDAVFDLVMQLMGVSRAKSDVTNAIQSVSNQVVAAFANTGVGPHGPVSKHYYQRWVKPKNSPFWNSVKNQSVTPEDYCNNIKNIPNITVREVPEREYTVKDDINALITLVVVLTFFNIAVPLAALYFQGSRPYAPIEYNEDGIPQEPTSFFRHLHYSFGAIVYSIFTAMSFIAAMVFLHASGSLFDRLKSFVPSVDWDFAQEIIDILGLIIIIINIVLLIFLWLQVIEMKNMIKNAYRDLVEERTGDKQKKFVPWNPQIVDICFRFCFGILFMSLMLSMLCVVIGIVAVGFAYAFVTACNAVLGGVGGFCIDFTFLGIPSITCGDDIQSFCNDWAAKDSINILWSSFLIFVGHFYLIASTGFAAQQRRSIPAVLALYPKFSPSDTEKVEAAKGSVTE